MFATVALSLVIVAGFGGQGPIHSGTCRGESLPRVLPAHAIATCTRAGWQITGTSHQGWHVVRSYGTSHPGR